MAKKIDLSGMKEFFFNHGEKVALGTCAFLALVLGLWGLIEALGAGKPTGIDKNFADAFKDRTKQIRVQIDTAPIPQLQKIDGNNSAWHEIFSKHVPTPYAALNEQDGDKRRNPQVLPIKNEKGTIQIDYIAGMIFAHETGTVRNERVVFGWEDAGAAPMPVNPMPKKGPKGVAANVAVPKDFVQVGQARRMVVVQAIFPMKQQVEEFRRALKMNDQGDMFKKDRADLPWPMGIDVFRHEVTPKGQPVKEPEPVLFFDKEKNKLEVMPALETLLREAIYDDRSAEALEDYIFFGLATPMPKLANRSYPRFTFPGFDPNWAIVDEGEKSQMLAGGGPGGPAQPPPAGGIALPKGKVKMPAPPPPMPKKEIADKRKMSLTEKELQSVLPSLAGRLWPGKEKDIEKDFNIYHVLGNLPVEEDAAKVVVAPKRGGKAPPSADRYFTAWEKDPPEAAKEGPVDPKKPAATAVYPPWERDALVRFIDVDVVPGKTYYYSIRVRMANPNFGKKDAVAFQALAANAELAPSVWVETEPVKIPEEYFLYAIDQQTYDDWAEGKGQIQKGTIFTPSFWSNYTPFQIQQWTDKKGDIRAGLVEPFVVGDWIVAEKQFVRKGDYIGKDMVVQVPTWSKEKDSFELPQSPKDLAKKEKFVAKGIHINLTLKNDQAPVLVDFTGGKKLTKVNTLEEETAVDALILMPDGKLKVLNSREASDVANNLDARDRQERVLSARRTIDRILTNGGGTPNGGVGPKLPGAKGGGG